MLPIHIVGHAGCGKTTLIVDLVKALTEDRGLCVGTMKHSAHTHQLDKPGKDSYLHRKAGAAPVTMVTEQMSAVYLPRNDKTTPLKLLETYYSDVDLVLIEGWISGPFQKIEIWRKAIGRPLISNDIKCVKAVVSDDVPIKTSLPVFTRSDLTILINFILNL